MLKWQKIYWLAFNALGRVVGAGFTLFGGVFTLWGVSLVLDRNATIAVNGMPSGDLWIKSIVLIAGVGMGVIGMMILMSRRYRPDLGDAPFSWQRKRSDKKKTPQA